MLREDAVRAERQEEAIVERQRHYRQRRTRVMARLSEIQSAISRMQRTLTTLRTALEGCESDLERITMGVRQIQTMYGKDLEQEILDIRQSLKRSNPMIFRVTLDHEQRVVGTETWNLAVPEQPESLAMVEGQLAYRFIEADTAEHAGQYAQAAAQEELDAATSPEPEPEPEPPADEDPPF